MSRRIIYRRQLLQAVEAFLETTPSSRVRAQQMVKRCYEEITSEAKEATIDKIIWKPLIVPLTDSVFYEDEVYLREAREFLLGHSSQNLVRTVVSEDFRPSFTANEAAWYAQLVSMVDFLMMIPFTQLHEATFPAWQKRDTWKIMRNIIPEAIQIDNIEKEYQERKTLLEDIAVTNPPPENFGDEKIYHLALQEITSLVTGINVGGPIVYYGYPIPRAPYSGASLNMSDSILWAKRVLKALSGDGGLFISWRLSNASTFDGDMLLVFFH
jgi:hypothetical protein